MKRIFSVVCLISAFAASQFNLPAWDGAGHMMIAAEAFSQLPPELKAQAIEVLKEHPDYQQWVAAYHPNPSCDLAAYVFMRSSTWPDAIRRAATLMIIPFGISSIIRSGHLPSRSKPTRNPPTTCFLVWLNANKH